MNRRYSAAMVLFPIALIWLVIALVWIVRNSQNEPDVPEQGWRRFVPRVPKRPWNGPSGSRSRGRKAAGASPPRD
jgi:hypothetical protein